MRHDEADEIKFFEQIFDYKSLFPSGTIIYTHYDILGNSEIIDIRNSKKKEHITINIPRYALRESLPSIPLKEVMNEAAYVMWVDSKELPSNKKEEM